MLCRNTFIFGEFIYSLYVLDIDVTRNGNNLKLKVKSEFSFSMHSNPYIHSTTILCDTDPPQTPTTTHTFITILLNTSIVKITNIIIATHYT